MTERATIPPIEAPEAEEQRAEPAKRLPGRPRGTSYRGVDAPLHEQMRRLLENGVVHSRTAAASLVVGERGEMAYGHGCKDSKIRRLVRRYPY